VQSNCLSGHFHRKLWVNNPDAFILRDTATPHYESETPLSPDSLQLEITALALSGGVAMLTDRMSVLAESRKQLVAAFLPPYPGAARPVSLFDGGACPRVYALDVSRPFGSWTVLAAYNWGEEPEETSLPLPAEPTHVFDFWRREYLGAHSDAIKLSLPPHGVRLISARPVSEKPMEIVGTAVHVTQGGVELSELREDPASRSLEFTLNLPPMGGGPVFIKAPGRPRPTTEGVSLVEAIGDDVYAVHAAGTGSVRMSLSLD
jgi:hypothetical protein